MNGPKIRLPSRFALVAFAGTGDECYSFTACTTILTALTSDASELTDDIAGQASAGDRCTSCGIERALQVLENSQRAMADATVLLLINGAQNVGGDDLKAASKTAELLVFLHRSPSHPSTSP